MENPVFLFFGQFSAYSAFAQLNKQFSQGLRDFTIPWTEVLTDKTHRAQKAFYIFPSRWPRPTGGHRGKCIAQACTRRDVPGRLGPREGSDRPPSA